MSRFAVIGHPIAHSKSPLIHRLFAEQTGRTLTYTAIQVLPEAFAGFVTDFFAAGGAGLNVTVPHKETAYRWVGDHCSGRAIRAKAVNTLYRHAAGGIWGDNTDGVGLTRDLIQNLRVTVKGSRILILGAGGAVRGVIGALLDEDPAAIVIANRTQARAQEILAELPATAPVRVCDFAALPNAPFDLMINGTSAGLSGERPPVPAGAVGPDTCCYDMLYGETDTVFQAWARAAGAACAANGLGMLVEQAAEAFYIWHGVRPDTGPVLDYLRRP